MARLIAVLVLLVLVVGCSTGAGEGPAHLDLGRGDMVATAYSGGASGPSYPLAGGAEIRSVAKRIIQSGDRKWTPSLVDYAPAHGLRCDAYTVDFHPNVLVLNHQTSTGTWRQLTTPLSPDESDAAARAFSKVRDQQ